MCKASNLPDFDGLLSCCRIAGQLHCAIYCYARFSLAAQVSAMQLIERQDTIAVMQKVAAMEGAVDHLQCTAQAEGG